MNDAFRRVMTVGLVVVLAAAVFFALGLPGGGDGYGLADFLLGRQAPETAGESRVESPEPFTPAERAPVDLESVAVLDRLSREFANLMDGVRPSVVSINTTKTVELPRLAIHRLGLYRYHEEAEEPGLGSGVIVSREGHVVTNYHVVAEVDDIEITTSSGEKFVGEVLGVEPSRDVAVLKMVGTAGREFPALPFGDSDLVRVGETVFAVGNPFGLGETVTQGIISARPRPVSDSAFSMFQTDTVINPGNSGGPLVNVRGEIIGINVAIYTGQAGLITWQGVSLAIPSNDVRKTFEAIMRTGRSPVGYLGVRIAEIDPREKLQLGIRDARGVRITDVRPGSPAESAGLKPGDVVLEFGGEPMRSAKGFLDAIGPKPVGEEIEILVLRDGEVSTLQAEVGNRSDFVASEPAVADVAAAAEKISEAFGIAVQDLNAYQRHRLGLVLNATGIMVADVFRGSPLAGKLERYDVIYRLNESPIYSTLQFYEMIDGLPFDQKSVLYFLRDGQQLRVSFTPRHAGP